MKEVLGKLLFLFVLLVFVSCTTRVQDQGILGTWTYTVKDAPLGFQTGRVIFYEENDSTRALLKVYGISIETANLEMDSSGISFTTQVEHEQISVKMRMQEDGFTGLVYASEGTMPVSMVRKGRRSREKKSSAYI